MISIEGIRRQLTCATQVCIFVHWTFETRCCQQSTRRCESIAAYPLAVSASPFHPESHKTSVACLEPFDEARATGSVLSEIWV